MHSVVPCFLASCAMLSMSVAAHAEDKATTIGQGPPRMIALYGFGMDLSGTIGMANASVPLDLPAADLISDVKWGGMGYVRWQVGNGFVYGDGVVIRFEAEQFEPFFEQHINSTLDLYEAGYGRHLRPSIQSLPGLELSPYAGIRYTRITADAVGPLLFQEADQSWVDPVIGMFAELPLSKSLSVIAKVDLAGMGITHGHYESAALMLRYAINQSWSLGLGYRIANADYESTGSDGIDLDLQGHGPQGGVLYSF